MIEKTNIIFIERLIFERANSWITKITPVISMSIFKKILPRPFIIDVVKFKNINSVKAISIINLTGSKNIFAISLIKIISFLYSLYNFTKYNR